MYVRSISPPARSELLKISSSFIENRLLLEPSDFKQSKWVQMSTCLMVSLYLQLEFIGSKICVNRSWLFKTNHLLRLDSLLWQISEANFILIDKPNCHNRLLFWLHELKLKTSIHWDSYDYRITPTKQHCFIITRRVTWNLTLEFNKNNLQHT